ncbi:hypothetical protein V8E51_008211 [Hyaloscypha variabilis]
MTLTSGQLTDLGDQTATLDHSELAQLAERISHMWFRSGEPDELLRNLHATFIYEILVEFPREIQALPLYQIPSGTLECFTFILMHWPPLNAQGMFAQTVNETSLSMRFVLLMFPDFQQFLVTDVWLRQEEICRPDGAKKSISELYLSNPIFKYHKRYLRILLNASNAGNIITFGTPARDTLQSILRLDGPSQGESVQKPNKLGDRRIWSFWHPQAIVTSESSSERLKQESIAKSLQLISGLRINLKVFFMLRKDFWNIRDSDFLCPDKLGSSIEFMNRLRPAYWMTATSRGDNIPQSGDTFGALLMVPTTGAVQARMTLPREPQPLAILPQEPHLLLHQTARKMILDKSLAILPPKDAKAVEDFSSPYEILSFRVLPQEPDQLLDQTALLSRRSAETLSPFQISALPQLFYFCHSSQKLLQNCRNDIYHCYGVDRGNYSPDLLHCFRSVQQHRNSNAYRTSIRGYS